MTNYQDELQIMEIQKKREERIYTLNKRGLYEQYRNPNYDFSLSYRVNNHGPIVFKIQNFNPDNGKYVMDNSIKKLRVEADPRNIHVELREITNLRETQSQLRAMLFEKDDEIRQLLQSKNQLLLQRETDSHRQPRYFADDIMAAQKNNQRIENRLRQQSSVWERIPGSTNQHVRKGGPGVPG